MTEEIKFEAFYKEWMEDITAGKPSTIELGRRFAHKLITQWLDISPDTEDITYCDGSGDGGIDVAYLQRDDEDNNGSEGHTWYIVQSKYGTAFQGADTIIKEGRKVIETLSERRENLSSISADLLGRLKIFRKAASDKDHLWLVIATDNPLNEAEMRALDDVRVLGQNQLGALFDVRAASVRSVYDKTLEQTLPQLITVPLKSNIKDTGSDLLVGTVSLFDLYDFLKTYQKQTGDLDQIYEKNVRRFLGGRGRVNAAIRHTLENQPEAFGLYNNGITIVVRSFDFGENNTLNLDEPFIVNGCQTTRTIWEVMRRKLEAGGTGQDQQLEAWKQQAQKGMVITKIVKVGSTGEGMLISITRYTNSQNAVREKDFLALIDDFRTWQSQMSDKYEIYLEIQRGGWDSRKAYQKQHPDTKGFSRTANAFDLLKVYGAGWLGEAGTAFSKNSPFLPNGAIYHRIIAEGDGEPFDVQDLYAAYCLHGIADSYNFGRGAEKPTRRQTRFLFYMVFIDILKDIMAKAGLQHTNKDITRALHKLTITENEAAKSALADAAIETIDSYLTKDLEDTAFDEPAYQDKFFNDLNAFLKWDNLGKSDQFTPSLKTQLVMAKKYLSKKGSGPISPRDLITKAIS